MSKNMIINYINEGAFGSYKGKLSKEDKMNKIKKETVGIVKTVMYKEFKEKMMKLCGELYAQGNARANGVNRGNDSFKKEYDYIDNNIESILMDDLKMVMHEVDGLYGCIEVINDRPAFIIYVEPENLKPGSWHCICYASPAEMKLNQIEKQLCKLMFSEKEIKNLYKEYGLPKVLDLKFMMYDDNNVSSSTLKIVVDNLQELDALRNILEQRFLNKEFAARCFSENPLTARTELKNNKKNTSLKESVFGNYKNKSDSSTKLQRVKKETEDIIYGKFKKKFLDIFSTYFPDDPWKNYKNDIEKFQDTIFTNIVSLNNLLQTKTGMQIAFFNNDKYVFHGETSLPLIGFDFNKFEINGYIYIVPMKHNLVYEASREDVHSMNNILSRIKLTILNMPGMTELFDEYEIPTDVPYNLKLRYLPRITYLNDKNQRGVIMHIPRYFGGEDSDLFFSLFDNQDVINKKIIRIKWNGNKIYK